MTPTLELFRTRCDKLDSPSVLEIGTRRVSGCEPTIRRAWFPHAREYIGIDNQPGDDVTEVVDAHRLVDRFGDERFDVVLSCSAFEHVKYPQLVAHQIMRVLKLGGLLYIQTHQSFPLHEFPVDYFRFSKEGLAALFNRFMGLHVIAADYEYPVVMVSEQMPVVAAMWAYLNVQITGEKFGTTPVTYVYDI